MLLAPRMAAVLATVLSASACGHIEPSLAYRSDVDVRRAPLTVAVDVQVRQPLEVPSGDWTSRLEAGSELAMAESLRRALAADLDRHGPFQIEASQAEATLEVQAVVSAIGDSTAWAGKYLFLTTLLGAPTASVRVALVAEARLVDKQGEVLATASAREEHTHFAGFYYGWSSDLECAARPVMESLRVQLAERAPIILAKLDRKARPSAPAVQLASAVVSIPTGPRPVVAVFDLEDSASLLPAAQSTQLTTYFASRLAERAGFRLVPRDQIRALIVETKAESYRACYDTACQIELGKALAAEKSIATRLVRIGETCAIIATLFDLRTETTEQAATVKTGCSEDALLEGTDRVVDELARAR